MCSSKQYTTGESEASVAGFTKVIRIGLAVLCMTMLVACDNDSDSSDSDVEVPPPNIAGIWSGTWEGLHITLGPVAGTWEADVAQTDTEASGPVRLRGDVDCPDGFLTATASGDDQSVAGTLRRPRGPKARIRTCKLLRRKRSILLVHRFKEGHQGESP